MLEVGAPASRFKGRRKIRLEQTRRLALSAAYARRAQRRRVRLFRNGRNQSVGIPVEFELPGDEAIMHRNGERLVIVPVRKRGLVALLKSMKPLDESFPEIDDPVPERESVL
jgi:antitoxin VapB